MVALVETSDEKSLLSRKILVTQSEIKFVFFEIISVRFYIDKLFPFCYYGTFFNLKRASVFLGLCSFMK